VPSHLREHFSHAVGLQTGEVADRVVAALDGNAPSDEAYLASLRADGFALSDEDAATVCNAPVCFVAGKRDRVIGYASLFDALGNYDYASYTCISSVGHYLPFEEPDIFATITRGWLEQCRAFVGLYDE
jgi:pimeloyl-ACP methyl ester carboxylesterase